MNQFEKVAILTQIESIEAQLLGLKKLVLSASGTGATMPTHTTTRIPSHDNSQELSEADEKALEENLRDARAEEVERMKGAAQEFFQREASSIIGGNTGTGNYIPPPAPHPFQPGN